MPPKQLPGLRLVARDESADSLIRPRNPGNHGVFHHQRSHRPPVMLRLLGHRLLPHQFARRAVQRQQVRIVRLVEHLVITDRHSAIRPERRIAVQSASLRPRVLPDLVSRQSIDRKHLVRPRDVHHSAGFERRHFQPVVRNGKDPLQTQPADIPRVDLFQLAIPVRAQLTVVSEPVPRLRLPPRDPFPGSRPNRHPGVQAPHVTGDSIQTLPAANRTPASPSSETPRCTNTRNCSTDCPLSRGFPASPGPFPLPRASLP